MTKAEIQQVKLRLVLFGNNEALMRAIDIAIQVAPTDLSVLITGESGVGRRVFRRLSINTAAESTETIYRCTVGLSPKDDLSELFGHEKGAFTGAIGERKRYFGEAGTRYHFSMRWLPNAYTSSFVGCLRQVNY